MIPVKLTTPATKDEMSHYAPTAGSPYDNAYTLPMPDPAVAFSGPGYYTPPPRSSALAIASLICALVGIVTFVPAIAAVVLGLCGLHAVSRHRLRGQGSAEAGLAIGALVMLFWVGVVAVALFVP